MVLSFRFELRMAKDRAINVHRFDTMRAAATAFGPVNHSPYANGRSNSSRLSATVHWSSETRPRRAPSRRYRVCHDTCAGQADRRWLVCEVLTQDSYILDCSAVCSTSKLQRSSHRLRGCKRKIFKYIVQKARFPRSAVVTLNACFVRASIPTAHRTDERSWKLSCVPLSMHWSSSSTLLILYGKWR